MTINNVSFGSVIALSGRPNKINKINKKLHSYAQEGNVIMKDVTNYYQNASSQGVLAQSAQKGDKVEIYITGEDIEKVKNKDNNWKTVEGILSNLTSYFNTDRMNIGEAIAKIFEG